ncbi:hypothetical protein BBOV_III011265 [Babesia bovis T2Bo]|uniref:hypothetical protein n=1 Tax=Babesia bovis T2Bo TaxID=484906 RepID=UPI001C346315|nr:hypothetical protein BBOV_III011265 [Babesia bovis T2Bo]KAG6440092.1 hypothetical protein BBOV_III011265 [Babesia bovis T2Bo]
MGKEGYLPSLRESRTRLSALLDSIGNGSTDATGLVGTYRALLSELDSIIALLQPSEGESDLSSLKAIDTTLDEEGKRLLEKELSSAISDMQNDASDAILFLEGLSLLAESNHKFFGGETEYQNNLIVDQHAKRDELLDRNRELEGGLIENARLLDSVDNDIAKALKRIDELKVTTKVDLPKGTSLSDFTDESISHKRLDDLNRLVSALDASPLKVLEEGDNHIVYEYTLGNTRSTLRVTDSSNGLQFTLDPMEAKAYAYLKERLDGCKSRIQIAAVLQEALTLP